MVCSKKTLEWQMVEAIKWLGKQDRHYPPVCFPKNIWKNVAVINNDGEHTKKIDDRVSLQLFSCNREADSKIALQASKFRANVMVVLKDTDVLMPLIYSHSTCAISKECVLKYGKNSYPNVGTIRKNFGNTVSRNILQYYAILGCDKFSFFYIDEKINTCQKSPEKMKLLGLTEYSGENKSNITLILKVF